MKRFICSVFLSAVSLTAYADNLFKGQWIDLTHDFSEEAIYWPTADGFKQEKVFQGRTDAGFYYTAYNFSGAEHGGTHVDSPIHFAENRNTVDQIPVDQLIGPGVVIRITDKAQKDRNYQLTTEDILSWEAQNGRLPDGSILLVDSGSGKFWPDKKAYMGTAERGQEAVPKLKFPGIHPDTAQFLVSERNIKAVGIDSPSIDYGSSTLFGTHTILFEKNIPGLENVANLDQLPLKDFTLVGLPMKIANGSGAPLRIVAFIPDD